MGTIKTTNIETITGSGTLTLGQSGETISVPSGATINLSNATQTGVGGVNTPYFEATLSSSTGYLTNNTYTKVQCDSEVHDSAGAYDNSTNYRFTPQTAGKYFIYSNVTGDANGDGRLKNMYCALYKNGSRIKESRLSLQGNQGRGACMNISGIFTMNGSTDYIELYGAVDDGSGSNQGYFVGGEHKNLFGGYKIIE